jgi:predicted flap endonuclease-1-like 5' DNA nuclease
MWDEVFKRWIDLLFWWVPRHEARPPDKAEERAPSGPEGRRRGRPDRHQGIGPAVQGKLRSLGIATFNDLARAAPKTLTERLKGSQPISEARVRGWTEAAREGARA